MSPVVQVYFEVGPGSRKAKDLAKRVDSKAVAAALQLEGMQDMIPTGDLDKAAKTMSNKPAVWAAHAPAELFHGATSRRY